MLVYGSVILVDAFLFAPKASKGIVSSAQVISLLEM